MGGKIKIDSSEFLKIHRLLGAYNRLQRLLGSYRRLLTEVEDHVTQYSSLVNCRGLQKAVQSVSSHQFEYGKHIREPYNACDRATPSPEELKDT